MTLSAWRIARSSRSTSISDMFSGNGAAVNGGRWNSIGKQMVYAADSRALAALEVVVHLDNTALLGSYNICEVLIQDVLCEEASIAELPNDWSELTHSAATQAWGDAWLDQGSTPAVKVPSVIVPDEWNFLLNPRHDKFPDIEFGEITPFQLDSRIGST